MENVHISAFAWLAPEMCYKLIALSMPKSLKKLLLQHIHTDIQPDSTVYVGEEELDAHRAVLLHWSPSLDQYLLCNEEDGYDIDLSGEIEPGTMRNVLNIMYGLPFGEHRGEDWNLVLGDFQRHVII
jgi:hypothetical protein